MVLQNMLTFTTFPHGFIISLGFLRRMLDSLDDVLNSDESPLEVKDPLALKFLPSTLLEELRVVMTGWNSKEL